MITVTIAINGHTIYARSAVRVETGKPGEPNLYSVDDGTMLAHKYHDGAVALAKRMLDTICEPKTKADKTQWVNP